jgi:hypothetical protein
MASTDRMSEAEVAIRLAERLLQLPGAGSHAEVAIDGAVIEIAGRRIFDIEGFLATQQWKLARQHGQRSWHGIYGRRLQELHISSASGTADVVLQLGNRRAVAECKGGPLVKKPGNPEHRILKEALGQALIWNGLPHDLVMVAVPDTPRFRKVVSEWQQRPLVRLTGIQIALVAQSGTVSGVDLGE